MLRVILRLFKRYIIENLDIVADGQPLYDETGNILGWIDRYSMSGDSLYVCGWTRASEVSLSINGQKEFCTPQISRPDVAKALAMPEANFGFEISIPYQKGRVLLSVALGEYRYIYELPPFTQRQIRIARAKLVGPFACDAFRALPSALRWVRFRDPRDRSEVKRCLKICVPKSKPTLSIIPLFMEDLSLPVEAKSLKKTPITIIVPVYNAYDLLVEALDRVKENTDLPWHLVLVEDCSSDERVRPYLQKWSRKIGPDQVTLILNDVNLGFIASVNRAFDLARTRDEHVVLLNSDAFVPEGWASRLIRPLLTHQNVATVTPMSNNAEIFNVPLICRRSDLVPGEADELDRLARRFHPDADLAVAPTGVGFCMAININYLKLLENLDTVFGRGYGEEVDWCQRARAVGGRHLGLPSLFVEHRGGSSFGSAEKMKLVQKNNALISQRYPNYDLEVQQFIKADPLATPRFVLGVAMTAERVSGAVPVYLAHTMGGGAEHYLAGRIQQDVENLGAAVILRVGGLHRWQMELHLRDGVTMAVVEDFSMVAQFLEPLKSRHIVYSCGVGDRDPVTIPGHLISLKRVNSRDSIEVLLHDFFPVSPSYCLLDSSNWYHGMPQPDTLDRAHHTRRSDGRHVNLRTWRDAWGSLISAADRVVVFSEDSRNHVVEAYPDAQAKIQVQPHRLLSVVPKLNTVSSRERVIGVLGGINQQKGASILVEFSKVLVHNPAAQLVIIGELDPAFALARPSIVHGRYKVKDIPDLTRRYGITEWLIPSIWPETFSYATHEALATGLPVSCFDLGAQAEAVKKYKNGKIIPLPNNPFEAVDKLMEKLVEPHKISVRTVPDSQSEVFACYK